MRASTVHRRTPISISDHLDASTPMQTSLRIVFRHTLNGHFHVDVAESCHLFGNRRGLPLQLPGKRHMHQVSAANTTTHGKGTSQRPYWISTVFARLEHFHHFARPEAILTIMRLVQCDTDQFSGQCESHEHNTSVNMTDATTLVGVPFNADGRFHQCSSLISVFCATSASPSKVCCTILCRCIGVATIRYETQIASAQNGMPISRRAVPSQPT